jgi:hypothetical protein
MMEIIGAPLFLVPFDSLHNFYAFDRVIAWGSESAPSGVGNIHYIPALYLKLHGSGFSLTCISVLLTRRKPMTFPIFGPPSLHFSSHSAKNFRPSPAIFRLKNPS